MGICRLTQGTLIRGWVTTQRGDIRRDVGGMFMRKPMADSC